MSDSESDFEGFLPEDIIEPSNDDIDIEDFEDFEVTDDEEDPPGATTDEDAAAGARWTAQLTAVNKVAFSGPTPGPTVQLDGQKNELDFLNLLFPEECYSIIVEETNRFAGQCQAATRPDPRWSPVSSLSRYNQYV